MSLTQKRRLLNLNGRVFGRAITIAGVGAARMTREDALGATGVTGVVGAEFFFHQIILLARLDLVNLFFSFCFAEDSTLSHNLFIASLIQGGYK